MAAATCDLRLRSLASNAVIARVSCQRSKLKPVTDEIARGIIVPAVEYAHARPVEMHRYRWPAARVRDPVDALLVG
jgi:hypothetical protein